MNILITGSNGQLGYDCIKEFSKYNHKIQGVDLIDFDITKREEVFQYMNQFKPDVIIHCAAFTQVDKAEEERDLCEKVNRVGTQNLLDIAKLFQAKFIYISTDYVFDGAKDGCYEIDDITNPKSVYGVSKRQGEEIVLEYEKSFIVRISWVFGIHGNNFVKTMLKLAETRNQVNVVNDQKGSPTYTRDLSQLLYQIMLTNKYGIYHATNEGYCTWYEFACEIFKLAKKNIIVNPIFTHEYPTKAVRPNNSCLSKSSLINNGFILLPDWKDALKRYMEEELNL